LALAQQDKCVPPVLVIGQKISEVSQFSNHDYFKEESSHIILIIILLGLMT